MVSSGKGRLFKRVDGKYLIYLPVYVAEDSMFPFKEFGSGARGGSDSMALRGEFTIGEKKLEFTKTPIERKKMIGKILADTCRLFRRKDGKYLIYLSKDWAEDSQFPFRGKESIAMKVSFKPDGDEKLVVEEWTEPAEQETEEN